LETELETATKVEEQGWLLEPVPALAYSAFGART
jgi:hypothetical protein